MSTPKIVVVKDVVNELGRMVRYYKGAMKLVDQMLPGCDTVVLARIEEQLHGELNEVIALFEKSEELV